MERHHKSPPPPVQEWLSYINKIITRKRMTVAPEDRVRLAALLTLYSPANSPEGNQALLAFESLLLSPYTFQGRQDKKARGLPKALDVIPPTQEAVSRVVRAVRALQVKGKTVAVNWQRLPLIVAVMVQIPDPEHYVQHLWQKGLTTVGAIFHENTLERARKEDLRGMFGRFEGESDYWNTIRDRIRTVE